MATSNIKLFDENKVNMMPDEAYQVETQRTNGVQSGIASSQLQNKTLYQVSLVSYAIAQIMNQNGLDANDSDAVTTFVNNLSSAVLQKVQDIASTTEAQDGVINNKWMSPSLVKAAIDVLAAKSQNILSDETKTLYGLGTDAVPDDVFAILANKNIANLVIEKIQVSRNWTAPKATEQLFKVFAVGGGGSGAHTGGGGGGGHISVSVLEIAEGTVVPIVCGAGGASVASAGAGKTGGTTTFGNLLTAAGGGGGGSKGAGGSGGAGGGGYTGKNGGNGGTYGGGGGGGSGAGAGGNGGTYGGGGGSGGTGAAGAGGTYGGNGGTSQAAGSDAPSEIPALSFIDILLSINNVYGAGKGGAVFGPGGNTDSGGGGGSYFGNGGSAASRNSDSGGGGGGFCSNGGDVTNNGGCAGGGGGYCGNGGKGDYTPGGGGGFFANGGDGSNNSSTSTPAGGGGGFFSDGKMGNSQGSGAGGNGGVLIMYFKED